MSSHFMQTVYRDLVPSGQLRAAINLGNPLVARRELVNGEPSGIAVDLANEIARRLSVTSSLLCFDGTLSIIEAGVAGKWDLAFLAIDAGHAQRLDFTPPYVSFEGSFVVRDHAPSRTVLDLDHEGTRIAVAQSGTYDLHLTRTMRRAQIMRAPTFQAALHLFQSEGLEAVAGLKQALTVFVNENNGLRLIDGRFAAIEHAIAVPKGHTAGLRYLKAFIEEAKASGRLAYSKSATLT
jgi:polar amino acid transport system substrate-binding protein